MSDIDFTMWVAVFFVAGWPPLATLLVYMFRRPRITRVRRYFIASTLTGYALAALTPVAIVFGGMLLGQVAEMAVVTAILLTTPLVVLLVTVAAFLLARRFAVSRSPQGSTGGS